MKTTASRTALALALTLLPGLAPAQSAVPEGVVSARLLPGWRVDGDRHMAALEITLAPGWKTYWRAPGDAGIPPEFAWDDSENVDGMALHWPVPEVSHTNGMRSIGYSGRVVIPMEFTTPSAGVGARVSGEVEIGVCADICIPVRLPLAAELPPSGDRSAEIVAALVDRPETEAEAGVREVVCTLTPIADGLRLEVSLGLAPTGGTEEVVIEAGDPDLWVTEPMAHRAGDTLHAVADILPTRGSSVLLDRSAVIVTVLGGDRAVEIRGCD